MELGLPLGKNVYRGISSVEVTVKFAVHGSIHLHTRESLTDPATSPSPDPPICLSRTPNTHTHMRAGNNNDVSSSNNNIHVYTEQQQQRHVVVYNYTIHTPLLHASGDASAVCD